MSQANIFLPKLKNLAQQYSPTLLEILRIKSLCRDTAEDVNNPNYLKNAFAVIAEGYIRALDDGQITFKSDSEKLPFLWLLQLLLDYAAGGKLEDLFKTNK